MAESAPSRAKALANALRSRAVQAWDAVPKADDVLRGFGPPETLRQAWDVVRPDPGAILRGSGEITDATLRGDVVGVLGGAGAMGMGALDLFPPGRGAKVAGKALGEATGLVNALKSAPLRAGEASGGINIHSENITKPADAAERLATVARERLGPEWNVGVQHSKNQVGSSSYIKVSRQGKHGYSQFDGRVSDHSVGTGRLGDYQWHGSASDSTPPQPLSEGDVAAFLTKIDQLPEKFAKADITEVQFLQKSIDRAKEELKTEGKSWGEARRKARSKYIEKLRATLDGAANDSGGGI